MSKVCPAFPSWERHAVVTAQPIGRDAENVVIYDFQKRSTNWVYLVINDKGEMYLAWPTRTNGKVSLEQKSTRPLWKNPNVDLINKKFRHKGYIPG